MRCYWTESLREKTERLREGEMIAVELPEQEDEIPKPENIPLDILYEDSDLWW